MKYIIGIKKISELLDDKIFFTNINIQRKFIYNHNQAKFLLDSISKNIPINIIYLWDNKNGTYDVIDGKQRITTMRLFVNPNYLKDDIQNFFIDSLLPTDKQFLDYEVPVYICTGTEPEKVETFRRLNTTAIKLTLFEILNALYQGKYIEELGEFGANVSAIEEKFFGSDSRGNNCIKMLELFTKDVEQYVKHFKDTSFVNGDKVKIENLVKTTHSIFDIYGEDFYTFAKIVLENQNMISTWQLNKNKITDLLMEYRNNGEIKIAPSRESFYKEILSCYNISGLDSARFFTNAQKQELYKTLMNGKTKGKKICPNCNKEFTFEQFQIDHRTAWIKGGQTKLDNADLLCGSCNASKGKK